MTEIPEHLLARSRARREAAGLGDGDAAAPTPGGAVEVVASAAPAVAATAAPVPAVAPAPPPPPKPDPPYIKAYKERKKIPYWAMPALALLPIWAFIYTNTLEEPSRAASDPLALGQELFSNCAACHGANGEGGLGPSFQNGAVVQTWPDVKDHILWVQLGSANWPAQTYGAQKKPVGSGGMPSFKGQLTDAQIVLVVRYEREVLAGAPPDPALVALSEIAATGGDVSAGLESAPGPNSGAG